MGRATKSPLPIEGHPGDADDQPGYVERREEADDEKSVGTSKDAVDLDQAPRKRPDATD